MSFPPNIFPWLARPHPVPAFEATALMRPGPRFSNFTVHSHVFQRQPFPGAPAFAYEGLGLVEYTPIGAGTINRNHLNPLATAGTVFAAQGLTTAGLGGLVQGQWIGQPLIVDPSQLSEDLYGPELPGVLP
jgi:hypothetical protein